MLAQLGARGESDDALAELAVVHHKVSASTVWIKPGRTQVFFSQIVKIQHAVASLRETVQIRSARTQILDSDCTSQTCFS